MKPPWEKAERTNPRQWRPYWTAAEWEAMERLRAGGLPVKKIAERIGRTPSACSVAWSRYGPSPQYRKEMAFRRLLRRTVDRVLKAVHEDPTLLERFEVVTKRRKTS